MAALALRGILLSLSFYSVTTLAQLGPSQLNISGGLFNPNGTPVTNSSVNFRLEVWDKNATCLLYTELHNGQNLSSSKGGFSLEIGKGTSPSNKIDAGNPLVLSSKVFENPGAVAPFAGCAAGVTLASGDVRLIRVYYDLGSGMTAMTPDIPIGSSAYAMVAETLQGKRPTDFVQVRDDATYDLNQANVESIFSAANFAKLTAILSGDASNQRLTNVVDPTAASDAATKGYADNNVGGKIVDFTGVGPAVGDGKTIIWDQAQNKWVTGVPSAIDNSKLPLAGGTMTGAIAMGGFDITNIGHMTMAAQRTLNLGTYTDAQETTLVAGLGAVDKGKVWFNTTSNTFKVWDGSAAVNSFAPSGAAGGDLTGTYPNPTIAANAVVASKINTDAVTTAKINKANAVAGGTLMMVDSIDASRVEYKSCALGEALMWTAGGWACTNVAGFLGTSGVTAATYGSATQVGQFAVDAQGRITSASNVAITFPVTSVAGKTGAVTLNTADITNAGTAATKDYGTAAGELVELDGTGKIPVGLMPTSMGDIQDVVAGSGLTGGGSSGAVTLSVDTGITTGKIVQMAASDKLPAVDGSNLTNINAVKIQARDVAATAPGANEVLMWNNSTSVWEPKAIPSAPVLSVASKTGAVTLDWGDITNAVGKYFGYRPNNSACADGEVLKWNNSASYWECGSDIGSSGYVTSVVSGSGLLGGNITATGTLSVDVGVTTGKIVQMAASDKLPAVDGSNLIQINAVRLQTRDVSSTAPTANQVLKWNNGTSVWEPAADTDTTTTIVASTGLTGGVITTNGTIAVDVGVTTGKIVQMAASDKLPAVDGSNLTQVNAVKLQTRDVASAAPNDNEVLTWNNAAARWESRALPAGNIGDITAVSNGTGLTGGGTSGDVTLGVDVGVTTGKIIQVAASDKLPVIDGSNLTNINAVQLQARNVSSTAPTANQVLKWNNGTSVWEPAAETDAFTGTVTSVVSGTGLTGGNITSTGTLAVDVGTTTGKIVQMAASDKLPAVDGSNLTGITASQVSGAFANNGNSFGAAATLGTNDNFALNFETNNATAMTILTDGKVGIGTATPASEAHVFENTNSNTLLRVENPNPGANAFAGTQMVSDGGSAYIYRTGTGYSATLADRLIIQDADQVSFWVNGGIRQHIANNGYVGINTSNPAQVFNVFGNAQFDGAIFLNRPASAADDRMWYITHAGSDDIHFAPRKDDGTADGNYVLSLQRGGNVGIGTANPAVKLDVAGVMRVTDICDETGANCKDISSGWGGGGDIDGVYTTSSTGLLGGFASGSGTLSIDTGVTTGKIIQVAASNKLPVIDGSNLTNINAVQLQARNVSSTAPTANQVLKWNNGTSVWEPAAETDAFTGTVTSVVGGTGLTGGNITSTGTLAVDVGTTTGKIVQMAASDKLPAVDGSNLTNLNVAGSNGFIQNGNSFGAAATLGTNDNFALNLEANNVTAMTILPNGRIGVGTTTPGTLAGWTPDSNMRILEIGGSGGASQYSDGILQLTNNRATPTVNDDIGAINFASKNDNGSFGAFIVGKLAGAGGVNGFGADLHFGTKADNGTPTTKLILTKDGNVGIGTTIPQKLINSTANRVFDLSGSGNTTLTLHDVTTAQESAVSTSGAGIFIDVAGHATATNNVIAFRTGSTNASYSVTERMRVDSAGNVGIGTTNPAVKLDVAGVMRVTDICDETGANCKDISGGWGGGGDIDGVYTTSSTGLLGGFASGSGTLSIDVGTTTGKIVQMAASNKLPAVDGSNLTGITASQVSGAFANNGNSFGAAATLGTNDNFALNIEANNATAMTILPSGFVGIGTTSPGYLVHVKKDQNSGTLNVVENTNAGASAAAMFSAITDSGAVNVGINSVANGGNAYLWNGANSPLTFGTNNAERMRLSASGFLGIGTNNPGAPLHVYSAGANTANFDNGSSGSTISFKSGGTSHAYWGWDLTSAGAAGGSNVHIQNDVNGGQIQLISRQAGGTRNYSALVVDGTGNIGIGTLNPAQKLEVAGTIKITGAGTGITFNDGSTLTSASVGSAGSVSNATDVVITGDSDANASGGVILRTGANDRMTILNNGNIGIGTATPSGHFHLQGSDTSEEMYIVNSSSTTNRWPALWIKNYANTFTAGAPALNLLNSRGSAASPAAMQTGDNLAVWSSWGQTGPAVANNSVATQIVSVAEGNFTTTSAPGAITFRTTPSGSTATLERMRINANGDVGIGTTNPASKLDVNGTITATGFSGPLSTSVGTFGLGTVGAPSITFTGDTNTGWWSPGADILAASTAGAERVRIDASGNVGIGTTNPTQPLDVSGTAKVTTLLAGAGTAGAPALSFSGDSNSGFYSYSNDVLGYSSGGTLRFIMDASIYSTVTGGAKITSTAGSASAPAFSFQGYDTSGMFAPGPATVAFSTGTAERVRIDSSGNVGIGTTAPTMALDVFKSTNAAHEMGVRNLDAGASAMSNVYVKADTASLELRQYSAAGGERAQIQTGGSRLELKAYNAAGYINFLTGGSTERMRIDASGNVGIGTTNPGYKFSVSSSSTATSGWIPGTSIYNWFGPSSASTADSIGAYVATEASGAFVSGATATGMHGEILHAGTGTVGSAQATIGKVRNTSTGTIGTGTGVFGRVENSGTGIITNARGIYSDVANPSGTVTNGYGVFIGTIAATNKWGLYQNDASSLNYFAGNVGIGTTSAADTLTVVGPANATAITMSDTNGRVRLATGSGINYIQSYNTGGDADLRFTSSGGANPRMTILGTGNVGIGTTNPAAKLDVAGIIRATDICDEGGLNCKDISGGWSASPGGANTQIQFNNSGALGGSANFIWDNAAMSLSITKSTAASGNLLNLQSTSTTGYSEMTMKNSGGTSTGWIGYGNASAAAHPDAVYLEAAGNRAVDISTNSVVRMKIDGSGNVGIGTAAPSQKFHVHLGSNEIAQLNDANTANPSAIWGINIGFISQGGDATVTTRGASSNLTFNTNGTLNSMTKGTERMRIDTAGNVAIGTNAAVSKLTLQGDMTLYQLAADPAGTAAYGSVYAKNDGKLYYRNGTGTITDLTAGTAASGWTDSGTNVTLVTGTDLVGIGTASPSANLHVNATSTVTSGSPKANYYYFTANPGAASTATYYGSNGSAAKSNNANMAGATLVGVTGVAEQGGTGNLGTATGVEAFVTKYGGGNITTVNGVYSHAQSTTAGTISAFNGLLVNTNVTAGTITTAKGVWIQDLQATTGYGIYQEGANDSNYFAGNVGIGTAAPGANLHVFNPTGDGDITVGTGTTNGGAGINFHSRQGGVTKYSWVNSDWPGNVQFGSSTGAYYFWNSGASAQQMTILANGNVGIGTATPNAKLSVQGGEMTFSQLAADPAGTANYGSVYVKTDGKLYYRNGTGTITDLTAGGGASGWTDGGANVYTTTATDKVGIGTSAPSGQLEVSFADTSTTLEATNRSSTAARYPALQVTNYMSAQTAGHSTVAIRNASGSQGAMTAFQGNRLIGSVSFEGAANASTFNQAAFVSAYSDTTFSGTNAESSLRFGTAANASNQAVERMRIDSAGDVGIGTQAPATPLHVMGTARATRFDVGQSGNSYIYDTGGGTIGIVPSNGTTTLGWGHELTIPNGSGTTAVRLTGGTGVNYFNGGGNFGIGTNNPSFPLDIRKSWTPAAWNQGGWMWNYIGGAGAANNYGVTMEFVTENAVTGAFTNDSRAMQLTAKATNDASNQRVYGVFSSIETHAGDSGFGLYIENRNNSNSTGGTQYGLYIDMADADVNNYGIYQSTANKNYFAGNVGIGTANPQGQLQVYGTGQTTANLTDAGNKGGMLMLNSDSATAGNGGAITFGNIQSQAAGSLGMAAIKGYLTNGAGNTVGDLTFSTRNATADTNLTERMRILSTGNVGIGSTNPGAKLDVVGDIQYTGTITDVSDRRLKENIQPIENGLDVIRQIPTYSFTMKNDPEHKLEYGVMAQDIFNIIPELTRIINKDKGYMGVNYVGLIPWSIRAIQDLDREVASVKSETQDLKARVEALEKQNKELSEQVRQLIEMHKNGQKK